MTIVEFYKMTFPEKETVEKQYKKEEAIRIEEKYLTRISEYLLGIGDQKERGILFNEIISKPSMDNGKVYELLIYAWMKKNCFNFKKQVWIPADDCLKKEGYFSDGEFDGVIFDIKKFGIGFPLYETFQKKLQETVSDYIITVGGSKNLDTKTIEKELLSKIQDWKDRLFSYENKLFDDYRLYDSQYGLEMRAHLEKPGAIYTSISETDVTQWAEENELYFFRHASQFCINKPYMVICPFLPQDFPFGTREDEAIYHGFRFLCRRMFMNVIKKEGVLLGNSCDGKAKSDVTLATAAHKLSAVVFLDISKEWDYNNCRCWVYQNPNADFPIQNYIMASRFRCLGAYIDDFKFDNY